MIVKLSIALFGPVVLGLYLQYDYAEYGSGLVEHFLKPKRLVFPAGSHRLFGLSS
jgi:hypothetical protein